MKVVVVLGLMSGFLFGFSFLGKLADMGGLRATVAGYNLVPDRLAGVVGMALLVAEGAVASTSIVRPGTRVGLIGASSLFAAFALGGRLRLADQTGATSCGCLGRFADLELSWASLGLNVVLALTCAAAALTSPTGTGWGVGEKIVLIQLSVMLASAYWLTIYGASALRKVNRSLTGEVTA